MRVGIVALLQETNTFVNGSTQLGHFAENLLVTGEAVRDAFRDAHHEVGGFLAGLAAEGIEAVPVFAARALPFGTVTDETVEELERRLLAALDEAADLDGVLAAPHGATVGASVRDVDGHWLKRVRERIGRDTPLIATADPHANVSPAMVEAVDGLIAYGTNPHVDQRARGEEAARLMAGTLRGEVQPVVRASFPPMVIGIERQCTSEEPCRSLCEKRDEVRGRPGVLSASLFLGFPYADVPEMGSAMVVIANGDGSLAQAAADELGSVMWARRGELLGDFVSAEEAVERAAAMEGPVCLLDMGDNVGGGSSADGTVLAHVLHERGSKPAFVCLYDPEAVREAETAGVGTRLTLAVGGKSDDLHGRPLEAEFEVLDVRDGRFSEPEPRHGGITEFDQGRTAIVRAGSGLTVMLTSRRMVPFSLHQLLDLGVDPRDFHFLVAKGVNAPLAAYETACPNFVRVDTPGVTSADPRRLEFHHRRRPMYPFEPETDWTPGG